MRSKKSKNKANLFQPLALVDMIVSNSEKGNLQRISEITIHYQYIDIPYSVIKSSIALFLNEVLYKALNVGHPDEDMFEFIKNSLQILDLKQENCSNFHLCFMLQLSRFLGFYPQGAYSSNSSVFDLREGRFVNRTPGYPQYLCGEESSLLTTLLNATYETIQLLRINKTQRKNLLHALIIFYQLHITFFGEIKSNRILEEVIV